MQRPRFPFRGLPSVGRLRLPSRLTASLTARPLRAASARLAPARPTTPEVAVLDRSPEAVPHDVVSPDEQMVETVVETEELDETLPDRFPPRRRPVPNANLARRARVFVALAALGVISAGAGAVATVLTSWMLLRDPKVDSLWPALGNLASVFVVLASLVQLGIWIAAAREWSGRRDFSFAFWLPISRAFAWVCVIAALVVTASALHHARTAPLHEALMGKAPWRWALIGAGCSVLGAVLAGMQSFSPQPRPLLSRRQRRASKR